MHGKLNAISLKTVASVSIVISHDLAYVTYLLQHVSAFILPSLADPSTQLIPIALRSWHTGHIEDSRCSKWPPEMMCVRLTLPVQLISKQA